MITRRDLAWLGIGGALGAAGLLPGLRARTAASDGDENRSGRRPGDERPGDERIWAADRARHRVVELDGDGLVVSEVELPAPVALAGDGAGGMFAISALEGVPSGPYALVHLDRAGRVVARAPVGRPALGAHALSVDARGRPIVAEREGDHCRARRFVAPERSGARDGSDFEPLDLAEDATVVVAARAEFIWHVDVAGRVGASAAEPAREVRGIAPLPSRGREPSSRDPRDRLPLGARAVAVAPDADGRGAWILARGAARAALGRWKLDPAGIARRVWLRWLAAEAATVAAASDGSAWIADGRAPLALRVTREGRFGAWRRDLPSEGIEAIRAGAEGGLWLAAGGALLRLAADGRSLPGQGGFGHLVALA